MSPQKEGREEKLRGARTSHSAYDNSMLSFLFGKSKAKPDVLAADKYCEQDLTGEEVCYLVSDMSGFTRLTKKYGIIHFASVIVRMRQICLPILHYYHAQLITTEADNFICLFSSARDGFLAAYNMCKAIGAYNASLPVEKAHFTLTLNGVAVHVGRGPIQDKTEKLHGEHFDHAYFIGEDYCEHGKVVITGRCHAKLIELPEFATAVAFQQRSLETDDTDTELAKVASAVGGLFDVVPNSGVYSDIVDLECPCEVPLQDDASYLAAEMLPFAKRHCPTLTTEGVAELDKEIESKFVKQKTVLMFELEFVDCNNDDARLTAKFDLLKHLLQIFDKYGGEAVEDVLHVFDSPGNAVLAAVECRSFLKQYATFSRGQCRVPGTPRATIRGYGVHVGSMLVVPGTDLHWGDPVNTSSKLGQDLAKDEQIIISDVTYEVVKFDMRVASLAFERMELEKSGNKFLCYRVDGSILSTPPVAQSVSVENTGFGGFLTELMCCSALKGRSHEAYPRAKRVAPVRSLDSSEPNA